jgi:hypothetical protein
VTRARVSLVALVALVVSRVAAGQSRAVSVTTSRCEALDVAAFERLLAIEWRDVDAGDVASPTVELLCESASVKVTLRPADRAEAPRERVIDVRADEWTVAPRIVALVTAQLASALVRDRSERLARAAAVAAAAARAARERATPSVIAQPEPVAERWAFEASGLVRARQWEAPWASGGAALAFGGRLGGSSAWLGVMAEGEGSALGFALGAVSFARGGAGPWLGWSSRSESLWGAHARAALVVGAQSLWARSDRADVDAAALFAVSVEARVRGGLSLRVARGTSITADLDAGFALPTLEGTVTSAQDVRAGGLSLGAALGLRWRAP